MTQITPLHTTVPMPLPWTMLTPRPETTTHADRIRKAAELVTSKKATRNG